MPRYTGINHLAMVTGDMDETLRFWSPGGTGGIPRRRGCFRPKNHARTCTRNAKEERQ